MDNLLSIHNAAVRCKIEKIPISEKAIRHFVKTGDLPAVQTGKKALVYFPNIINFIKSGNNQHKSQEQYGIVRPLRA